MEASLDFFDAHGNNALRAAALHGNHKILRLLLEAGCDVDATPSEADTLNAIAWSEQHGYTEAALFFALTVNTAHSLVAHPYEGCIGHSPLSSADTESVSGSEGGSVSSSSNNDQAETAFEKTVRLVPRKTEGNKPAEHTNADIARSAEF